MNDHPGIHPTARIHPTAIIEEGVAIGAETAIWDNVHIRHGARIGRHCIVGEKAQIAYGVVIGDYVKLAANVHICAGVAIEEFCMISMHTVFTNERFPRAGTIALTGLQTSDPTDRTLTTLVRRGTTIGGNATIGPGVTLGEFCMVGMGAVVTRNVASHQLVIGNPARFQAWVCACGDVVAKKGRIEEGQTARCQRCGREFRLESSGLRLTKDNAS